MIIVLESEIMEFFLLISTFRMFKYDYITLRIKVNKEIMMVLILSTGNFLDNFS